MVSNQLFYGVVQVSLLDEQTTLLDGIGASIAAKLAVLEAAPERALLRLNRQEIGALRQSETQRDGLSQAHDC